MAAQRGRDFLLKVYDDAAAQFQTVAGLRERQFSLQTESIDITHTESAENWREILESAGTRSASLSGNGLFKDSSSDALVRHLFFNGSIVNWQVCIPDFGIMEGPFHIARLEYAGTYNEELRFEITLESAGILNFTSIS